MGNRVTSSLRGKFQRSQSSDEDSGRPAKRKREEETGEESDSGRKTPPPGTAGLAPSSDIHTPKRSVSSCYVGNF